MGAARSRTTNQKQAAEIYQEAMVAYRHWDVDQAVEKLQTAVQLAPREAIYHMNLAQALARAGDFDRALRALANYLRLAPESKVAERVEQLFASGMDPVEEVLTQQMRAAKLPLDIIGATIQMWMEYRITLGEEPLRISKPATWAAALDYTARKVNLHEVSLGKISREYGVSVSTLRDHHKQLTQRLDIMPCDYRYFTGDENPLDKLVEAAEMLERLEQHFQQED
ncbi:MAG: hypothetical protein U9Q70_09590 [Chloroflexota bacterium]|nr:hypothetical protein [Chloroflexota bacterium]